MIRFICLNAFIAIHTIIFCLLAILLSFFDKNGRLTRPYVHLPWSRAILRICGIKVRAKGQANVKEDVPSIFMCNHQSYFDIFVVLAYLPADFRFILKHMHEQRDLMAHTPSFHPTKGLVIARFGYRKSPFTGQKEFHRGLDIANQKGTSVVAAANGTVAYTQDMGVLGNVMAIDHGYGLLTRYAHLGKFLKKKGDPVKKGEVIAELGDTGLTTGPHLHYEVHVNGTPADPVKYILDMNECFLARNTF